MKQYFSKEKIIFCDTVKLYLQPRVLTEVNLVDSGFPLSILHPSLI